MKTLMRLAVILTLATPIGSVKAIDSGASGSYYNPNQSGHGIFLEILSPSRGLFTWYVYDGQGSQVYLVADGPITGNRLSAQAFITRGMRFGSFNPQQTVVEPWGTITLDFNSCNSITMSWQTTYSLNGFQFSNGSTPLTRLSAIDGVKCGKRLGSGVYSGFVVSPANPNAVGVVGLLDERGQLTFVQNDGGAIYLGSYVATGASMAISAAGFAAPGFSFPSGSTTATFNVQAQLSERDFVTGTGTGGGSFGLITLGYLASYDRPGSLARVAGSYTSTSNGVTANIIISGSGALSGTDSAGCTYQGTVSPIDPQFNAYALTVSFGNCGAFNGLYTGVGTLADLNIYGDNRSFVVGGRGPTFALVRTLVK